MKFYYSSKLPDEYGITRIHRDNCLNMPEIEARIYLGLFPNGNLAIEKAKASNQLLKWKICNCCGD